MRRKKLRPRDLDKLLRKVHMMSEEQRNHVKNELTSEGNDFIGLSHREVRQKLSGIKHEVPAKINRYLMGKVVEAFDKEFAEFLEDEKEK